MKRDPVDAGANLYPGKNEVNITRVEFYRSTEQAIGDLSNRRPHAFEFGERRQDAAALPSQAP
jgi:hypothetical protein